MKRRMAWIAAMTLYLLLVGCAVSLPAADLPVYQNNAEALAGGLQPSQLYRLGGDPDLIAIVHEAGGDQPSTDPFVLDDFNRPNENPIDPAKWTPCPFPGNYAQQILNGKMTGTVSDESNQAYWSAATFGPDAEVYATLSRLPMGSNFIYFYNRFDFSTLSGYEMIVFMGNPNTTFRVGFYLWINGSMYWLGNVPGGDISPGDKISFHIVGKVLGASIYHGGEWRLLGTITDRSYVSSKYVRPGYIGIGTFDSSTEIEDFAGRTINQ